MAVNFFYKRFFYPVLFTVSFFIAVFSFVYAFNILNMKIYETDKTFYFLVLEDKKLEVASYEAKLGGGAGFLLNYENCDYVALSVYLSGEEGEKARESVLPKYQNAKIITINSGKLYMKRASEKKQAKQFIGTMNSVFSCIELLNGEIYRIEKGATQQSSNRVLSKIIGVLKHLSKENSVEFPTVSSFCEKSANALSISISGIIYAKDLRYILCEMSDGFIKLSEEYPL